MNMKRNFVIVLFLSLLFCFMTAQTEDMTREEYMTSNGIHNDSAVQTIVDPMIVAGLADSESQVVSLRTTHELTNSEITYLESQGVIFRRHNGQVTHAGCIYLAEVESNAALSVAHGIGYIEYLEGDNVLNDIHLDQSIPEINADITYTLRDPVLSSEYITGSGVTVAIIDSGIDYQHPDFYFADGGEYYYRYDAIGGYYIDLDDDSAYDVGEKSYYYDLPGDGGASSTFDPAYDWRITDTNGNAAYDYGIDGMFVANDINDNGVLDVDETCVMLDTCKISKIWDQTTGNYYTRGVNLTNPAINTHTDTNGHGTHVAGTVAGGQFGYRTYVGVAPDAEIMMVETTFSSVDIMDAVIWAVNEGADVITMSIGGYIHRPLDGSTNYELVFDWAYDQGVPSTISAGNSADDDIHSSVTLPASTESTVRFEVTSSGQSYVYFTTLWRDSSNSLTLRIQPPYALFPSPIFSIPLTGSVVNVENNLVYAYRYTSSRDTAYIALYITYQSPLTSVETGTWTLYVNNPSTSSQFTHTYIYPAGSNKMIDYVNSAYTVGSPGTADHVIAVTSYVTKLGGSSSTLDDISVFSSIGPRIDGLLKPEIAAPGELIMSAASIDAGGSSGGHTLMQGTSMSCPHAAGVLALEIQCHPAGMSFSSSSLRNDLLSSAEADSFTGSIPNIIWGYGKMDAFEAVVREWPQVSPVISELTIDDVSFSNQQTIDILRGEPFVLSVLLTEDQSYLDLLVEMEFSALGGPVEGSLPLIYDPTSGRWNSTLTFNPVADIDVYNLTIIATDPLFTSDPHTIFVNLLNELPEIHSIQINETSAYRTNSIEFSVNASDYRDLTNLTVTLCLHLPDSSWLNTTMTWNGSLFVRSITFNITNQIGSWDVYVRVADWDDGVVSEFYGSFLILNNEPTVSGSLVSSTVGIGTSLEVDVTCDDTEDGWNGLTVVICLQDSGSDWSNFTVVITSGIDTASVDTTGLDPGYYEVYVLVVDQDGMSDESYCGTVELVDADLPTIDSPSDITYDEFTTGRTITWSPGDLHPENYTVYLDDVEVKFGIWNS
ncbi:MAG: S8 family serine peptidase, partial [Candidatus Thorarchaeota archaeon]